MRLAWGSHHACACSPCPTAVAGLLVLPSSSCATGPCGAYGHHDVFSPEFGRGALDEALQILGYRRAPSPRKAALVLMTSGQQVEWGAFNAQCQRVNVLPGHMPLTDKGLSVGTRLHRGWAWEGIRAYLPPPPFAHPRSRPLGRQWTDGAWLLGPALGRCRTAGDDVSTPAGGQAMAYYVRVYQSAGMPSPPVHAPSPPPHPQPPNGLDSALVPSGFAHAPFHPKPRGGRRNVHRPRTPGAVGPILARCSHFVTETGHCGAKTRPLRTTSRCLSPGRTDSAVPGGIPPPLPGLRRH